MSLSDRPDGCFGELILKYRKLQLHAVNSIITNLCYDMLDGKKLLNIATTANKRYSGDKYKIIGCKIFVFFRLSDDPRCQVRGPDAHTVLRTMVQLTCRKWKMCCYNSIY